MCVGPPAVGRHDARVPREQPFGVLLVPVWGEVKEGVVAGEHAPQRAALAGGAPARLVHVEALAGAHALSELLVGVRQRLAGALQDRLDGAGA